MRHFLVGLTLVAALFTAAPALAETLASAEHGHDIVVEVVGDDENYMRGFHDGSHGRIDADDMEFPGHPVGVR